MKRDSASAFDKIGEIEKEYQRESKSGEEKALRLNIKTVSS